MFFTITYGGDEVSDILDELDIMFECADDHYKERRAVLMGNSSAAESTESASTAPAAGAGNHAAAPAGDEGASGIDESRYHESHLLSLVPDNDESAPDQVPSSKITSAIISDAQPQMSDVQCTDPPIVVMDCAPNLADLMDESSSSEEVGSIGDESMDDQANRPSTPGATIDFQTLSNQLICE